ncbi:uncharacterized protein A1O9_05275 [Exophiala aquamarina CBS 119918]|uniref:Xylanolytic transcriptional activator regulatory domain-containing protein n=1 Tax=Exophiala aquamarina CBS 119918 TaxID=1182545 RepID=A0A072PDJ9_9EURO|nr:uncharacterized protein A1O9_05275 [Exophiala aquamarina CBS 119918]KEF57358.1 hypothetical protein A1O9_05275 [Exophiala aquamarina CBS 119918]
MSPVERTQPSDGFSQEEISPPQPPMLTTDTTGATAQVTLEKVMNLARRMPQDEPTFSRILLTEPMTLRQNPSAGMEGLSSTTKHLPPDMIGGLDTSPVSLPTKEAAQNLVRAYLQFANLSLPLLHEPTFNQKLDLLYSMSNVVELNHTHANMESRVAVFFVFEVFAVALLTLQKQDPSRIPASLADRYHRAAVRALNETGLPSDVEGVQALLLVGQYCYHHPTIWAVWKTVGAALRLAVELNLHRTRIPTTWIVLLWTQ